MDQGPLTDRIVAAFDAMPVQLQTAARYVLDRPSDVALLSMREQARQAGVQPATMTRLAKRLGLDGYDAVREMYAETIRTAGPGFARKAGAQVASQKSKGDRALASEMVASLNAHIARLAEPAALGRLAAAAARLSSASRVYCLGVRSAYSIALHLHYILSLFGRETVLLDSGAGIGRDPIRAAGPRDVLFAVSIAPYTRETVEAVRYAHGRGVPIVALTDSEVSPLAQVATDTILVATDCPSFYHTMVPAFAVAEILAALVAGRSGPKALEALKQTDDQLTALNVHWSPQNGRTT
jgi:DNA-binding MurR/RpiR family transcriptional regulator